MAFHWAIKISHDKMLSAFFWREASLLLVFSYKQIQSLHKISITWVFGRKDNNENHSFHFLLFLYLKEEEAIIACRKSNHYSHSVITCVTTEIRVVSFLLVPQGVTSRIDSNCKYDQSTGKTWPFDLTILVSFMRRTSSKSCIITSLLWFAEELSASLKIL